MGSPWYQHHYIGEFAGDALATANVATRGWGAAPPNGLLYFDTLTGTLRYANGGVWNPFGGGGPVTKHDYGTLHTQQPPIQRALATAYFNTQNTLVENNAQRRICADTSGNKYVGFYFGYNQIAIAKIGSNHRTQVFYVPVFGFNDFTLCINSLDELVLTFSDGTGLYIIKTETTPGGATYIVDGLWTTPVQINVTMMSGPYGVVAAIDSNDQLWVLWGDIANPVFPDIACPMYYAQYDCSVLDTTPTVVIAEALMSSPAYPQCWALEIDGSDQPHVVFGWGAFAPNHNLYHTYFTSGVWSPDTQMETQTWTNPWWNLSMVITRGRVCVTATQDDGIWYYGTYMDAPYIAPGLDPPVQLSYSFAYNLGGMGIGSHEIGINELGQIIHSILVQYGNTAYPNKVYLLRTDVSFTPDETDGGGGGWYYQQIYDLGYSCFITRVHWAMWNHNRPNYDYPLIMFGQVDYDAEVRYEYLGE